MSTTTQTTGHWPGLVDTLDEVLGYHLEGLGMDLGKERVTGLVAYGNEKVQLTYKEDPNGPVTHVVEITLKVTEPFDGCPICGLATGGYGRCQDCSVAAINDAESPHEEVAALFEALEGGL